ncbi:hypothetical protein [Prochlorococcus sp. MIT 1223]|uniref:hypothetical protein n=1 Tax=Prochlorococcus sp. MIT 1223 TaxID=3096217 RepID=UPI002A752DE2|nr:hypothetical protein [Prochlorococcus sp. MIT 1223]
MDKETLLRLAQPAATSLLALSIFSIPMVAMAGFGGKGTLDNPIYVRCIWKAGDTDSSMTTCRG